MAGVYWDKAINPVAGCTPASEACAHCYAREMHERFHFDTEIDQNGDVIKEPNPFYSAHFDEVVLKPDQLKKFDQLARSKSPKIVFVGNMTDLFHEKVPDEYIHTVFASMFMNKKHGHTFLILTKRAKRMKDFISELDEGCGGFALNYTHVWLGVTAENQARADERIPLLLETPAAHRWVSVEPMLSAVDLNKACWGEGHPRPGLDIQAKQFKSEPNYCSVLDLVICGGESGRNARPSADHWFYSLKKQCDEADVKFHFKQWDEKAATWHDNKQVLDGIDYSTRKPADIWRMIA